MPPRPLAPRPPLWARHPKFIEWMTLVVIAAATVGGLLAELLAGYGWLAVPAPLLAAASAGIGLRHPRLGLAGLVAAPLLSVVLGQVPLLAWTLTVFAGFLLCFRGLRGLWPGLLLGGVNYAAMALMLPEGFIAPTALVALSMTLVATSVGSAARSQLRYFDSVEQRARDALATRDAEATRRVAEERLRIARDLHDVVGHEIAVLGMHLSVAEVTLTSDPAKTRESLGEARKGVQSVLRETQNILSLLRPDASDSRRPSPDGSGIDELVRNLAAAGMTIDADIPSLTTLAPSVGLTAYRIVQEALTNAQRYGDGTARVRVERTAHDLVLEVSNPESSAESSGPSGGHGLVGMRERATSAGGRLLIDRSGGRFTVRAELPLGGAG